MPQRNVASNFTFEQQRVEINNLAQDFWSQKGTVDTALPTFLKHDGSNAFTGQTLSVPNAFTINSNSGNGTVTIAGNLQVDGTTTTVNTATMDVVDKNITIAKGSANDAAADGAGITIDSATDITFNFVDAKDALVSSIGLEAATFVKATRAQFTGAGNPTTGQGLELTAPDQNTGQIASYDRDLSAYKELRLKGSTVSLYTGTTNAITGTFNSNGLAVSANSSTLTLQATNPSNTSTSTIKFKNLDGNSNYRDVVTIDGESTGNGGYGAFVVNTAFNNSLIERMRIGQDGQVDFAGNVDCNSGLDVTGGITQSTSSNGQGIAITGANNSSALSFDANRGTQAVLGVVYGRWNGTTVGQINFVTGDNGTDKNDGYITFGTESAASNGNVNATERLRINDNGRVAIGNSTNNASPVATLQVVADDGEAEDLYVGVFKNLEATAGKSYGVNIQAGSNATDHGFRVKNKDNNETQFLVRGDGRVGIGEDQPADKFVVQGATPSGDIGIRVKNDTVTDGDNANPTSASLYLNTSTGNFNTFYIQARRNDNNTHFGYADPRDVNHTPNMCIANTGQVLIGSATENTSDRFTIVDPGNAFMSLRSDQPGDNVSQFLDFIVGESNRASTNMVSSIRSTIPSGSTAGGTLKGELSFWTNEGDSITEQLTIKDDGDVLPGSDNAQDLGSSSLRWANVYTGDMHLNNMNTGGNEVDGSEGHWTMQEGADDLFLINRNTGKKYKFNLTEVS